MAYWNVGDLCVMKSWEELNPNQRNEWNEDKKFYDKHSKYAVYKITGSDKYGVKFAYLNGSEWITSGWLSHNYFVEMEKPIIL